MRHGPRSASHERLSIPGFGDLQPVGGDAVVTRHRGEDNGREVLVVAVRPGAGGDDLRRSLADQAGALVDLEHPNLVRCLEVALDTQPARVVYVWPGDTSLAELVTPDAPAIEIAAAVGYLLEACRGLDALHRAGLTHLGLRPACIHLQEQAVRLGDLGLGLAAMAGPRTPADAAFAPEVILGLPADIRADIHALGAMLFRLTVGSWPWVVEQQAHLDAWARAELPEWPEAGIGQGLMAVLRRMLARSPQNRYATPADVIEDLERVAHGFSPIHARIAAPTRTRLAMPPGTATVDNLRRPPVVRPAAVETSGHGPAAQPASAVTPVGGGTGPLMVGLGLTVLGVLGVVAWSATRPPAPVAVTMPASVSPVAPQAPQVKAPAGPAWASASGEDAFGRWAEVTVAGATLRLRRIPAGDAWIGSPLDEPGRKDDEDRFQFTLTRDLWCAESEIPQAFFQAVIGSNPSQMRGDNLPVENVTWADANAFCARLSTVVPGLRARLPTEAEWEYACRAGSTQAFAVPARDGQPRIWDIDASGKATHPVRRLAPNAWGLYDMHGNVLEWTADAMASYPKESVSDRQVLHGAQRVARGGAWSSARTDARSASRYHLMPTARFSFLGFRIVGE